MYDRWQESPDLVCDSHCHIGAFDVVEARAHGLQHGDEVVELAVEASLHRMDLVMALLSRPDIE